MKASFKLEIQAFSSTLKKKTLLEGETGEKGEAETVWVRGK